MANLVIVESPAKAKTIKKYLGSGYKVEASMGHLRDLPKSQFGVDVENDFDPKYIAIRGKGDLISKLRKEAKSSDKVFLATDPDREGEAISWHLASLLDLDDNAPIRVTFNEITKVAVKNGIKNPRKIEKNLVDAQQARRVLDRIVGYKLSPLLWRRIKKGLSAGRVQSAAAKVIIDREREISKFVPQEYWHIDAKYQNGKKTFTGRFYGTAKKKMELSSEAETNKVLKGIDGKEHIVSSMKKGERQRSPQPPFITSTLQQEASRKLNFQSRRTMSVAQELYEGIDIKNHGLEGLITYMRTDSLRITADAQTAAREWIKDKYGEKYCPKTPRVYKTKKGAQDAHEAIRPTNMELTPELVQGSLSNDQFKLYRLIWNRFMASQMENALYETQVIDILAGEYIFRVTGQTVIFSGFIAVYEEGTDSDEDKEEKNLPKLEIDDKLKVKEILPEQKFTQPPPRFTEASLIKALEEAGVGRPSTYAPTITTILARSYIIREGKSLKPTPLGEVTTDLLSENFPRIVDMEFTANMEEDLDKVEDGERAWKDIIREFYEGFEKNMKEVEERLGDLHIKVPDEESDVVCDKCGRLMVFKMGKFGKFLACPGFPECRNTKPIAEETGVPCPLCGEKILLKKTKTGKKYYGCEKNPECSFMSWDEPLNEKCPKCNSMLLKKTKWDRAIHCSKEGCDYQRSGKQ